MRTIKLTADASQLMSAISEVSDLVNLERTQAVTQILECLFSFPDFIPELASIKVDDVVAPGTGELRVRVKPSDTFLGVLFALRTRNLNLHVV